MNVPNYAREKKGCILHHSLVETSIFLKITKVKVGLYINFEMEGVINLILLTFHLHQIKES